MVSPDQRPCASDRKAGKSDHLVPEDLFAGEYRNDVGDHPHSRKDHDVDRRVGIDPEQVLVHKGVAPLHRIEQAGAEEPLCDDQRQGDAKYRGRQNLHPSGGIDGPDKERKPSPGHPFGPQTVDGGDEVEPGQDRGETDHEDAENRQRYVGAGPFAVGYVEGPAGVRRASAGKERGDDDPGPDDVEPPGEEVQPGERHVPGADLDRHDQVPECAGEAWDDEEKDHQNAVDGEYGIVGLGSHDGAPRRHQLDAEQDAKGDGDQEEGHH